MISVLLLKPASYNPRTITDWELRKLMRSIEGFGFVEPVVCNKDMTIIGGHQRVEAAKNLGMEEVPCVVLDLSKAKEKSLNLSLNRISGDFDEKLLQSLLQSLNEEEKMMSGFDVLEIEKILNGKNLEDANKEINLDDLGEGIKKCVCPKCGHEFEG